MSLEWLMGRGETGYEDTETIRQNMEMEDSVKAKMLCTKRTKGIADVLEEVAVVIDMHFNEFSETKSSQFLQKVMDNQGVIDTTLIRKTWTTLNCTPKTLKVIREFRKISYALGNERS